METQKAISDFEDWLRTEEESSENTVESYLFSVKDFFDKYGEVTKRNVVEWKNYLAENFAPATVNLRLNAISKYCRFAHIPMDIKFVKIQKKNSVENVITAEQYNKLTEGLIRDGECEWAAYIKILAKTGARISEALKFTKKDLDEGKCTLKTKGKIRTVRFPRSLKDDVSEVFEGKQDDERIMLNRFGKPITARGFSGRLKEFAKKYGIPEEVAYPHSFRHFFAIEFLKRNPNIALLADILGHSGVNTTMIYLRMSQQQQQQELDAAVNW